MELPPRPLPGLEPGFEPPPLGSGFGLNGGLGGAGDLGGFGEVEALPPVWPPAFCWGVDPLDLGVGLLAVPPHPVVKRHWRAPGDFCAIAAVPTISNRTAKTAPASAT